MIASMTAFGRLENSGDWGRVTWELRTVNHRYLEMFIRLPEELRVLENGVRERISARLGRGKVDCLLRYEASENYNSRIAINLQLANKLVETAESLAITGPSSINPVDILRWPGVIEKEALDTDAVSGPILDSLDAGLDLLITSRKREGEKIQTMILERCTESRLRVSKLRDHLPEICDGIRERYMHRANEMNTELDKERLEQEMLLLAQKMDVAEELDRLDTHLDEVTRVMGENKPVGRRLDFLMQEMNREANTLGSKAAHLKITNTSVELKVLIEQMREQIQNIE